MLSVFLPIVFLVPFHHHGSEPVGDDKCEQCPGHFGQNAGTDDCLLCKVLLQQYVASEGPCEDILSADLSIIPCLAPEDAVSCYIHHSSPRAPPVSFCYQA